MQGTWVKLTQVKDELGSQAPLLFTAALATKLIAGETPPLSPRSSAPDPNC